MYAIPTDVMLVVDRVYNLEVSVPRKRPIDWLRIKQQGSLKLSFGISIPQLRLHVGGINNPEANHFQQTHQSEAITCFGIISQRSDFHCDVAVIRIVFPDECFDVLRKLKKDVIPAPVLIIDCDVIDHNQVVVAQVYQLTVTREITVDEERKNVKAVIETLVVMI